MLDYADIICLNKFDKAGALDALHDVRKQYKRNHNLWDAKDEDLPVVGTIAAQFNDIGVNELFERLMEKIETKTGVIFNGVLQHHTHTKDTSSQSTIIPPKRVRYLSEIAEGIAEFDNWVNEQSVVARQLYQITGAIKALSKVKSLPAVEELTKIKNNLEAQLDPNCKKLLDNWPATQDRYRKAFYEFTVRDRVITVRIRTTNVFIWLIVFSFDKGITIFYNHKLFIK